MGLIIMIVRFVMSLWAESEEMEFPEGTTQREIDSAFEQWYDNNLSAYWEEIKNETDS